MIEQDGTEPVLESRGDKTLGGIGTKGKSAEFVGNQSGHHLNGGGSSSTTSTTNRGAPGLAALRPIRSRAPRGFVLVDEFGK